MLRSALLWVTIAAGALPACRDQGEGASTPSGKPCFSTTVQPGAPAETLFERRGLQGGGPTWAGVLDVLVREHGSVGAEIQTPGAGPGFGRVYSIQHGGKSTWFALDEEGDAATFCAGSPRLLREVREAYEHLRRDPAELEKVLDRVNPDERE